MTSESATISLSSKSSEESDSDSSTSNSDTLLAQTGPLFVRYLTKIARKHTKKTKDGALFTKFLATLPIDKSTKRHSEETLAEIARKRKKTQTFYLCVDCDEPFADKDELKKHQEACSKKETNKTPSSSPKTTEKAFPCDKCDKSYVNKANLQRHVRSKHEISTVDSEELNKTQSKNYKCLLCKDVRINIYKHYGTKHNIDNVEQMLLEDGTVLISSDIDTDNGNAPWFKEQLKKASDRYKLNDTTCRFCEDVQFDRTDLLKSHYSHQHHVDAESLKYIKHMFRAEMKAHLGKPAAKSKRVDKKVNVSDKKKVIIKEKRQNEDNIRFIYKCKCGNATQSYDAAVEHAQDHLVAKYTKTKMGTTSNAVEIDIADNSVLKVINYDFETLLTEAWYEMFNVTAADKDRILSSSIYKYSRSVRLRSEGTDSSTCIPAYRCEMCQLYVHPEKIELHCKNYTICPKNKPDKYYCDICDVHFYSDPALKYHKENHAAGFRLVTLNNKNDVQINNILEKQRNRLTGASEEVESPIKNADGKRIEITSVVVSRYCTKVGTFVDVSAKPHSETHQKGNEYSGNANENNVPTENVNNETATGEVTEEPQASQYNEGMLNESGDIPVYIRIENDDVSTETDSSNDSGQSPEHSKEVNEESLGNQHNDNANDGILSDDEDIPVNVMVENDNESTESDSSSDSGLEQLVHVVQLHTNMSDWPKVPPANDKNDSQHQLSQIIEFSKELKQILGKRDIVNENH